MHNDFKRNDIYDQTGSPHTLLSEFTNWSGTVQAKPHHVIAVCLWKELKIYLSLAARAFKNRTTCIYTSFKSGEQVRNTET